MAARDFYIFPTKDAESCALGRMLVKQAERPFAVLLPELLQGALTMELIHAWEEASGKRAAYWAGSLWDIPLVRRAVNALRTQTQQLVLAGIEKEAVVESDLLWLVERDEEARRCLSELLSPQDSAMELAEWRELTEILKGTQLKVGTLPWSATLLNERDPQANEIDRILLPRFIVRRGSKAMQWPSWLSDIPNLTATAARQDARGQTLLPDQRSARHYNLSIQERDTVTSSREEAEPDLKPLKFRLKGRRLKAWQEQIATHIFSVTELENYARSPYGYWLERVLQLQGYEEEGWDLAPNEIGILIHEVLEQFYGTHQQAFADVEGPVADREKFATTLDRSVDQAVATIERERTQISPLLVARQVQRIKRALRAVLATDLEDLDEQKRPLRPRYFEWKFGFGDTPPLKIMGHDGQVILLRGQIDRIDVDPLHKTFLVIDYKTGARKLTGRDIERGEALQLPIYIKAVRDLLLPEYTPIGAVYFSLADMTKQDGMLRLDFVKDYFDFSMRSSSIMPLPKWQAVMDQALDQVRDLAADIYAGRFPRVDDLCSSYCPYQDMCLCSEVVSA